MATELPEPPWRVLAHNTGAYVTVEQIGKINPQWFVWSPQMELFGHDDSCILLPHTQYVHGRYLQVIDHPRNDPEALELINNSKARQQDG